MHRGSKTFGDDGEVRIVETFSVENGFYKICIHDKNGKLIWVTMSKADSIDDAHERAVYKTNIGDYP